jgi:hypothetical protein
MKQTAVNFLEDCIDKYEKWISGHYKAEAYSLADLYNDIEQAKEMEKQQIVDAYKKGFSDCDDIGISIHDEYYNETFNK